MSLLCHKKRGKSYWKTFKSETTLRKRQYSLGVHCWFASHFLSTRISSSKKKHLVLYRIVDFQGIVNYAFPMLNHWLKESMLSCWPRLKGWCLIKRFGISWDRLRNLQLLTNHLLIETTQEQNVETFFGDVYHCHWGWLSAEATATNQEDTVMS